MSKKKSQLNLNLGERTNTSQNIPIDLEIPSYARKKPRETFKTAFFNFMRDFKKSHKHKQYKHVVQLGARRWNGMTETERVPYILEAARNRRLNKSNARKKKCIRKRKVTYKKDRSSERKCPACGHGHHKKSACRSSTGSISRSASSNSGTRSSKSYKSYKSSKSSN